MTATQAREWIEHCPPPGPIAKDLLGWRMTDGTFFCSVCIGRIMARGIGTQAMRNAAPQWFGEANSLPACACCGLGALEQHRG